MAWRMSWRESMSGTGKLKFAGVSALVVMMTLGGGVGVYAYASPDVNVMHPLYPIKEGLESTEVYFAPTPRIKAETQLRHARRRMEEMKRMEEFIKDDARGEEGMKTTILLVRKEMNDSLSYASDEDSVNGAIEAMDSMRKNLRQMDEELGGMYGSPSLSERKMVKAHLEDLQHYTKLKMKKIDEASRQMTSPMRIKGPRVIMKCLTDDGETFVEELTVTPVPGEVPQTDETGMMRIRFGE
jgi:hypothetical protein